jgi:hypothetical protein
LINAIAVTAGLILRRRRSALSEACWRDAMLELVRSFQEPGLTSRPDIEHFGYDFGK